MHSAPPLAACTLISRVRSVVPSPQAAEQGDQPVQEPHSQFTGQASVLQSVHCSWFESQASPPKAFMTRTVLIWRTTPPPQVVEQVPLFVQPDSIQSTGQFCVLHSTERSKSSGQVSPPWSLFTSMERTSVSVPPPHSAEHSLTAPQGPTTQSTGHSAGGVPPKHSSSFTSSSSQGSPPYMGWVAMPRLRSLVPGPQGSSQADQLP